MPEPLAEPSFLNRTKIAVPLALSILANAYQLVGVHQKSIELKQKSTELEQKTQELAIAQSKVDADQARDFEKSLQLAGEVADLNKRLEKVNADLVQVEHDNQAAQVAMGMAKNPDEYASAHSSFEETIPKHAELLKQQQEIQSKLDSAATDNH